ncbi:MAG: hypothetical protein ABI683_15370, partial [Ginsengibacter sp.]
MKPGNYIRLLFTIIIFFLTKEVSSQIKYVWALGDGEKVFRDDLDHTNKKGNFTWDGKAIHLKGLFNEVLAFQVIAETADAPVKNIELSVALLLNKKTGDVIPGNTLKYGPAGTIEIFTEQYLQVKDSTPPNWFYGSPAAAP